MEKPTMKVQINSDRTVDVDMRLTSFVEDEVSRVLSRFAKKLTRVEVHLSDIDNIKTGRADKRCLIEARPVGDHPRIASAKAIEMDSAVQEALGKMRRSLTTFFDRRGRPAIEVSAPSLPSRRAVAKKASTSRKAVKAKKAATTKSTKLSPRGPKKKGIYHGRRRSWPSR